eukprot:TRINITY_DN14082_c0_g1_i8.p1 TRINITY_DN14082_c0_g1~~TRINITY_DN14082_c0_g1_i8.p1  ORF type:complete len:730 (+),score=187.68 TRINITY_DN14082_c0_g1_i8:119-2308(+)
MATVIRVHPAPSPTPPQPCSPAAPAPPAEPVVDVAALVRDFGPVSHAGGAVDASTFSKVLHTLDPSLEDSQLQEILNVPGVGRGSDIDLHGFASWLATEGSAPCKGDAAKVAAEARLKAAPEAAFNIWMAAIADASAAGVDEELVTDSWNLHEESKHVVSFFLNADGERRLSRKDMNPNDSHFGHTDCGSNSATTRADRATASRKSEALTAVFARKVDRATLQELAEAFERSAFTLGRRYKDALQPQRKGQVQQVHLTDEELSMVDGCLRRVKTLLEETQRLAATRKQESKFRPAIRNQWSRPSAADLRDVFGDMFGDVRKRRPPLKTYVQRIIFQQRFCRLLRELQLQCSGGSNGGGDSPSHGLPTQTVDLYKKCINWDIDVFDVERNQGNTLTAVFMAIWKTSRFSYDMRCTNEEAREYISVIESSYKDLPYHNQLHAAEVTAATASLLHKLSCKEGMSDYWNNFDWVANIFAAAVHDVGHVGYNNAFLVSTRDDLAIRYNDKSVLENLHAATAFQVIKDKSLGILKPNEAKPSEQALRARVIEMLLCTDMAFHGKILEELKQAVVVAEDHPTEMDKQLLERNIVHFADIGHPMKPKHIHEAWSQRATMEFFRQGDEEKRLGMQPMALFDRDKAPPLAKGQLGFFNFVIFPSWAVLQKVFGEEADELDTYLQGNFQMWEEGVEKAKEAEGERKDKDEVSTQPTKTEDPQPPEQPSPPPVVTVLPSDG